MILRFQTLRCFYEVLLLIELTSDVSLFAVVGIARELSLKLIQCFNKRSLVIVIIKVAIALNFSRYVFLWRNTVPRTVILRL